MAKASRDTWISRLSEFVELWYTYGAEETERTKRLAIATGGFLALIASIVFLAGLVKLPSNWDLPRIISTRFSPRDFAYIMTILTALMAGACTAFFGIVVQRSPKRPDPDHDVRWQQTALVISLFSAIAATLTFAGVYASASELKPSPRNTVECYMLIMGFIQTSICLGLAGVTVIPVVSNRPGPILGSIVSAISFTFYVPAAWMVFLILALGAYMEMFVGLFFVLLFLTMAQVYYPHGWHRRRSPDNYAGHMRGLMGVGYLMLEIGIIVASVSVLIGIVWPVLPDWYFQSSIAFVFLTVGVALLLYSISVEGTRKMERHAVSRSGQLLSVGRRSW